RVPVSRAPSLPPLLCLFSTSRPLPGSTLFPYTTLFRSSYLGFLTLAAEINPHPALKAAVPESPMVDGWRGDDWFHNGAFRTGSLDRKSTRLNSSHGSISYAVFCLKKKTH